MSHAVQVVHLPPGARRIRLDGRPMVSVVVASSQAPELLSACLAALAPQCAEHRAEIVVARRERVDDLAQRYPAIRWVAGDSAADESQLRGLGLAAAQGDIVALTDDRRLMQPNWIGQLFQGDRAIPVHRDGPREASLPATPGHDWVAYFAAGPGDGRTVPLAASRLPALRT
jgi:hypothetical protein